MLPGNQIMSGYHADEWSMINFKKGDMVYGGLPGQSSYYTDLKTVLSSQGDRSLLGGRLQVTEHPKYGYRPEIGVYEIIKDVKVPSGTIRANPALGPGGGQQYFINKHSTLLQRTHNYTLEEIYEHHLPRNGFSR